MNFFNVFFPGKSFQPRSACLYFQHGVLSVLLAPALAGVFSPAQALTLSRTPETVVYGWKSVYYSNEVLPTPTEACWSVPVPSAGRVFRLDNLVMISEREYRCFFSSRYPPNDWNGPDDRGSVVAQTRKACNVPYILVGSNCIFTTDDRKSQGETQTCGDGTNPINLSSGNKFHIETLYHGAGAFPLQLVLSYNSSLSVNPAANMPSTGPASSLGIGWQHTYQRQLSFFKESSLADAPLTLATISRPNGQLLGFQKQQNGLWKTDADSNASLLAGADGGWVLSTANDEQEFYDAAGKLRRIRNRAGLEQTLSYEAGTGRLLSVQDANARVLSFGYDEQGMLKTLTTPGQQVFGFGQSGNKLNTISYPGIDKQTQKTFIYDDPRFVYALTGLIDQNNIRFATWSYDNTGRAISSEHAGGIEKVTLDLTRPTAPVVRDSLQQVRSYGFETIQGKPRLKSQDQGPGAGCNASSATLKYDANGNIREKNDFDGRITTIESDPVRNLEIWRQEGLGANVRNTSTEWHTQFRLPKRRAEPKLITTYEYDVQGNLYTQTEQPTLDETGARKFDATPTGTARVWTYTYYPTGQIKTATGPRKDKADVTTYEYDARNNLASIKNSAGHLTQLLDYTADGDVGRIIDPNNLSITLHYTPLRQIEWVEISDGKSTRRTSYRYTDSGQLKQLTRPDASIVKYDYDDAQRLFRILDTKENYISYTLDVISQKRVEEVHDASGNLLQQGKFEYDGLKRLQLLTQGVQEVNKPGEGYSEKYEYDAVGRLSKITDGLQQAIDMAYDELGRVKLTTLPALDSGKSRKTIETNYDARDQLNRVRDPRALLTTYDTDGLGNQKTQSSPDTGITNSSEYDTAGNLKSRTDARNITTTYTYDSLNRLLTMKLPTTLIQFAYDIGPNAKGHLSKVTDPSGQTQWQYNMFGQVIQKDQIMTQSPANQLLRQILQYGSSGSDNGKLKSLTYPSGITILYAYAPDGKLQSLSLQNKDGSKVALLSDISFRPFGAVQAWSWGNSSAMSKNSYARGFDQAGRIKSYPLGNALEGGVFRTLKFDNGNRVTAYLHSGAANAVMFDQTFDYDGQGHLKIASSPANNQTLGYQYDDSGNRTALQIGGNIYTNTIDPKSNRLTMTNGPAPARTNQYDAMGNLKSDGSMILSYGETGRLQGVDRGTLASTYQYNGMGERVVKQTTPAATGREKIFYAYDDAGHTIGEYDAKGNPIAETVYLGDLPVAVLKPQTATPNKALVYYVYADHLNTPRVIVRAQDNKMVWRMTELAPFGERLPEDNPGGFGVFEYNLRAPGQVYDVESGLHYNYFRDYDPVIGRYVQSDPIGLGGGINTYGYVGGNPVSYADPLGLAATGRILGTQIGGWVAGIAGAETGPFDLVIIAGGRYFGGVAGSALEDWVIASVSSSAQSPADESQRVWERQQYHKRCDEPEPPGLSNCEKWRWRRDRAKQCIADRDQYSKKWYPGSEEPGHATVINNLHKAIENLNDKINRFCPKECP